MRRLARSVKSLNRIFHAMFLWSHRFPSTKTTARWSGASIMCFGTLIFIGMLPGYAFRIGNVFFGDIPVLYNTVFARTAFMIATHPLIPSQRPPMFAHYQLSRINFIEGDYYGAIDEANKELAIYPGNTKTYYIIGLTYGYLGRAHEGIEAFSKYIGAYPGTWAGRNDKAWLEFRIGDYKGALETIEPIASQFPKTPWVQNSYCILLVNVGRYDDALPVCENARSIIEQMSPSDWGHAYPGNDPRTNEPGLGAMRESIDQNITLLKSKINQN